MKGVHVCLPTADVPTAGKTHTSPDTYIHVTGTGPGPVPAPVPPVVPVPDRPVPPVPGPVPAPVPVPGPGPVRYRWSRSPVHRSGAGKGQVGPRSGSKVRFIYRRYTELEKMSQFAHAGTSRFSRTTFAHRGGPHSLTSSRPSVLRLYAIIVRK